MEEGARTRIGVRASALALLLALVAACGDGTGPGSTPPPGPFGSDTAPDINALLSELELETGLAEIAPADLYQRIGLLAHDSMQGRLTGTAELEQAAAYIASELAAMGLEPAGRDPGAGAPVAEDYFVRWDLPPSFDTGWEDTLATRPPNVAAVLPGSDPGLADSYVVVTAHFDHVGTRPVDDTGDGIFNGADDNASGTAALLEVAQALSALPEPPRRSVLFLAVSGEELGLLGSQFYLALPTVPVADMVADINLDMISRGPGDAAWIIGYGLSTLGLLAQGVTSQVPAVGLEGLSDQYLGVDLISRSDHFPFLRARIPAVGLFGGFHPDYHTPADEVDTIDPDKAAGMARLATYLVATIATLDDAPRWTSLGRAVLAPYW